MDDKDEAVNVEEYDNVQANVLENVLAKKLPSTQYLVWKNFFFGRVFRKRIPNFRLRGSAINLPQDMHEEWFDILEQFVDFPRRRIRAKTQ
jgi:hypothetical protein